MDKEGDYNEDDIVRGRAIPILLKILNVAVGLTAFGLGLVAFFNEGPNQFRIYVFRARVRCEELCNERPAKNNETEIRLCQYVCDKIFIMTPEMEMTFIALSSAGVLLSGLNVCIMINRGKIALYTIIQVIIAVSQGIAGACMLTSITTIDEFQVLDGQTQWEREHWNPSRYENKKLRDNKDLKFMAVKLSSGIMESFCGIVAFIVIFLKGDSANMKSGGGQIYPSKADANFRVVQQKH